LVIALSVASWSFVQATGFNLPAGEGRGWGFNPLAWQLIFLAGFAFSRGWVVPPGPSRVLLGLCTAYLVFGFVAEVPWIWSLHSDLEALHDWAYANAHKPNLDLRQFAHFLALAYIALWVVRDRLHLLTSVWGKPFVRLGQQALPVFFAGMALSHVGGMTLAVRGTAIEVQIVVHVLGVAALFAVAEIARAVKNAPWKSGAKPPAPVAKFDPAPAPPAPVPPISVPSVAR
ncbi:MAG: OpgC domain-containing protein, partial [Tagaea sp.]|nr:OpgC domain-containing protein [Tagaea sp.]